MANSYVYTSIVAVFCAVMLLFTICCVPSAAAAPSVRMERSFGDTARNENMLSICPISTPCGWAVYTPFSRNVDYFMQNNCGCTNGEVCVRTEDDLSVSAFVYRCRVPKSASRTTTTTTTTPAAASSSSSSTSES